MKHLGLTAISLLLAVGALGAYTALRGSTGTDARANDLVRAAMAPVPDAEPASEAQLAMLVDGVVTREEVVAALNAAADCLEARGVTAVRVGDPHLNGQLVLGSFVPDGGDKIQNNAIAKSCSDRHSGIVTSTYRALHRDEYPASPPTGG